jgi:hypothetical protein
MGHREKRLSQHAHGDVSMPRHPLTDLVGIHPELVLGSLSSSIFHRTPAVHTITASAVLAEVWQEIENTLRLLTWFS